MLAGRLAPAGGGRGRGAGRGSRVCKGERSPSGLSLAPLTPLYLSPSVSVGM